MTGKGRKEFTQAELAEYLPIPWGGAKFLWLVFQAFGWGFVVGMFVSPLRWELVGRLASLILGSLILTLLAGANVTSVHLWFGEMCQKYFSNNVLSYILWLAADDKHDFLWEIRPRRKGPPQDRSRFLIGVQLGGWLYPIRQCPAGWRVTAAWTPSPVLRWMQLIIEDPRGNRLTGAVSETFARLCRVAMGELRTIEELVHRQAVELEEHDRLSLIVTQQRDEAVDFAYTAMRVVGEGGVNNRRAAALRIQLADGLLKLVPSGDERRALCERYAERKRPPRPAATA